MGHCLESIFGVILAVAVNELAGAQPLQAAANPYNPAILEADAWGLSESGIKEDTASREREGVRRRSPIKIRLTGLAQVDGIKRVFLALPVKGDWEQVRYLSLGEGEQAMGLRVIDIRPRLGEVTIQYGDDARTLNLKEHRYEVRRKGAASREGALRTGGSPEQLEGLIAQLRDQEAKESRLRQEYSESHPKVENAEQMTDILRKKVTMEPKLYYLTSGS